MEYAIIMTPIGALKIIQNGDCITNIDYVAKFASEKEPSTALLRDAVSQLNRYFNGELKEFNLPIEIRTTPFRKKVLTALMDVKYGETISYSDLAAAAGNPKAARAVGTAMSTNPLPIIVPCHRVLPKSGALGNYSLGSIGNKEWLLTLEKQNSNYIL